MNFGGHRETGLLDCRYSEILHKEGHHFATCVSTSVTQVSTKRVSLTQVTCVTDTCTDFVLYLPVGD